MLNYSLHRSDAEEELLESELKASANLKNPFPGLRPFGIDECHLFFGREDQVDEILYRLSQHRFIALLGYSGSGKSSLMHCGVIPVLYGGFMTNEGPNWNVVVARPGESPIKNLASAILRSSAILTSDNEDYELKRKLVTALLTTGSKGLVEVAKHYKAITGENLLILIDQFEELYRFAEQCVVNKEEASQFINLLVDAIEEKDTPIYVATTMRSDFIGESAQYPRLIDHINESSYVIPLMSRQQKRRAIEGPVAVGGGRISERLVNKLLQEVGDNQDQLPIMQHALMRTWEYWLQHREKGEEIDIRHYNAIGKISDALSLHADEAYDELTDKGKRIAEILFKALTETGEDNFGIRRRSSVKEIAAIAGVTNLEVIDIVEHFRKPGRSLLMPALPAELTPDSILEISHESLMRIWTRLRIWVEEETESAKMYIRISEAAEMNQVGRSSLWRPPDLQLALNWQKKQMPTRQWADRYNQAFERATVFLETSKLSYEAEQRSIELKQKRDLKRAKVMAVVLGAAAIIAIFMFVWAITRQIEATTQEQLAKKAANDALIAQKNAENEKDKANEALALANQRALENKALNKQLTARLVELRRALEDVKRSEEKARLASEQAILEKNISVAALKQADSSARVAASKTREAERYLMLTTAQSMATKSVTEPDSDLKGLLAQQAYLFNKEYQGNEYDKYIYNGLYQAMANFEGANYNAFTGHRGAVRGLAFGLDNLFYSVSSDGTIKKWDLAHEQAGFVSLGKPHDYSLRGIALSEDKKWVAVTSDSSAIELYNAANFKEPMLINVHKGLVRMVKFIGNEKLVSVGIDGKLSVYNITNKSVESQIDIQDKVKAFDISMDGSWLVAATETGKLIQVNLSTKNKRLLYELPSGQPIHDVEISSDEFFIAFGGEDTNVYLWSVPNNKIFRTLRGHTGRINSLEFSHDGMLLASASFDGSVLVWNMFDLNSFPLEMNDDFDNFIWDVAFSPSDNYLIIASQTHKIKKWPIDAGEMADQICKHLQRNMTIDEWDRFVGNEIKFRNTCISLLIENNP